MVDSYSILSYHVEYFIFSRLRRNGFPDAPAPVNIFAYMVFLRFLVVVFLGNIGRVSFGIVLLLLFLLAKHSEFGGFALTQGNFVARFGFLHILEVEWHIRWFAIGHGEDEIILFQLIWICVGFLVKTSFPFLHLTSGCKELCPVVASFRNIVFISQSNIVPFFIE